MNADVEKAVERMCTPLHESRLSGATAQADARDMALICQALRDQEAEIARLQQAIKSTLNRADSLAEIAQRGGGYHPDWGSRVLQAVRPLRITAHLGVNHD